MISVAALHFAPLARGDLGADVPANAVVRGLRLPRFAIRNHADKSADEQEGQDAKLHRGVFLHTRRVTINEEFEMAFREVPWPESGMRWNRSSSLNEAAPLVGFETAAYRSRQMSGALGLPAAAESLPNFVAPCWHHSTPLDALISLAAA